MMFYYSIRFHEASFRRLTCSHAQTPHPIDLSWPPLNLNGSLSQHINPLGSHQHLPSCKLTVCDIENGPVEIVDLPFKHGDFSIVFPHLPGEGY